MTAFYRVGVRLDGDARGLAKAAAEAERIVKQSGARNMSEYRKMAEARKVLGVKSEHEIQREIVRTEAAYRRLARSGTLSWREQQLAARAMREEVTKLTNEMGRLTNRQKVGMGFRGIAIAGAGVGTAAAALTPKVNTALEYDVRLAHLANTAYNDRDIAGRTAGVSAINDMIVAAVRNGGGTRDSTAGAAEELFGAGIFKPEVIPGILRSAVRAGTANNADSTLFAKMAIASQTMGIKPERLGAMFGMGTFAGQQGGFEIKDMAKWLPQQMAAAKAVGLFGESGFAKLAAVNQAAVITAGTRDEAGNNIVNLLAKIGSQDTGKDFKRLGIDLPKKLAEGRLRGLDALDVVGDLLQQQLGKDRNYQAVQRQLALAKDDSERRAALEAVGNIAQGTVIGKVFQDRQALMGLYGYMQGRDRVSAIARGAMQNTDAGERNFALIASTPGFKVSQRREEQAIAMQSSMEKIAPTVGTLNERITELMREYPGYTTAIATATSALFGMAGAAATLMLIGGGKGAGASAGAARALGWLGAAGRWGGGVGLAAAGGYGLGTLFYKGALEGNAGGDLVGRGIAGLAAFLGNKDASAALEAEGRGMKLPQSLSTRLGASSGGGALPLLQQDLRGEILLRVQPTPGYSVQAETRSSQRSVVFRTDAGRTNTGAGQ